MKRVEVIADTSSGKAVSRIADKFKAVDFHVCYTLEDGRQVIQLLVTDDRLQEVLDSLQSILGAQPYARILVTPLETVLPRIDEKQRKRQTSPTTTREALYATVEKNVALDLNYTVLVALSTVVAAIGLMENNAAVVIGAMVIAPLLSPNLALGLGTALGDLQLMKKSLLATFAGIGLAILLSTAMGMSLRFNLSSPELMARTVVGLDSVVLALASGAAAALSLTTGLSSVLVGVMVAVALLPPAVTLGLMLGVHQTELALGAGLLLAVNLVCVNLAAKLVFFFKGVRPRTGPERQKAQLAMMTYVSVWLVTLLFLVAAIYARRALSP